MQPPLPKPEPSPSTHIGTTNLLISHLKIQLFPSFSLSTFSRPPDARQNSSLAQHSQPRVKSEQVEQDLSGNDLYVIEEGDQELDFLVGMETEPYPNDLIVKQDDNDGQELGEPEPGQEVRTIRGGKRLLPGPHRRRDSLRAEHRRRLDALLNSFMGEHRWKEAAAVVSVLLRWAPLAYNISDDELRRYYTVCCLLVECFVSYVCAGM